MKCMHTFCLIMLLITVPAISFSQEIIIDDYRSGISPEWENKLFEKETLYKAAEEDGRLCIRATSKSSASGLYYKIEYDAEEYPIMSWSWKINGVLSGGDALKKEGDDYPARIYVVFPSVFFWKTKAINYIWANKLPKGEAVPNQYTANAIMIAVESGNRKAGRWVEEERNVFEDFKKQFGYDPPGVGAISIMTDTDNTGEEAVAWYGPIRLLKVSEQ